ncbi:hypothetical protein [Photobacterium carnosum]|uniref:DUF4875 domain-containing protein n=1 Tax=Photobacterium carnosum TaxID=2023717 RepID=UPI001E437C87|nr:hypothetical protein [Photobacterium carnosum]MCD9497596.1 hypothetical protein [Photobacterium carnosum]
MALVACKECKKEISDKAKICPSCGIKDPAPKKESFMEGCLGMVGLFFIGMWIFSSCGDSNDTKEVKSVPVVQVSQKLIDDNKMLNQLLSDTNLVKPYKVTKADDIGFAGRDRMDIWITASEAKTMNEKFATAATAAKKLLAQYKTNYVSVVLKGKEPRNVVVIGYAPDHKGISGDNIGVSFTVDDVPPKYLGIK